MMGTVHDLIEAKGHRGALSCDFDRKIVDTAQPIWLTRITASVLCNSGGPRRSTHRRLKDDQTWQINSDMVKLLLEPGRRANDNRRTYLGRCALWLAGTTYLALSTNRGTQNQFARDRARKIASRLAFKVGYPNSGKSLKDARDQAERISRCRMSFHIQSGGRAGLVNQNILDTAMFCRLHRDGARQSVPGNCPAFRNLLRAAKKAPGPAGGSSSEGD